MTLTCLRIEGVVAKLVAAIVVPDSNEEDEQAGSYSYGFNAHLW